MQIAGCLYPLIVGYVAEVNMDYNNSLNEYRYLVDLQKEDFDLFLIETTSNIEEALSGIS